ncbi:unnamed protein product [Acanthoscelides obtectus]|uniref:Amidase domain-containing protein n=1 Tax=Acanthoscelides obtectus TaxID=200917 RepID=A0A9P0JYA3_ACAOB|nr:unnamed protein product [Acanthoscelides obtectus]CAK1631469.1 Fatty-acid amide hydrolase 2 [Acanthoscelides obtectus]
MSDSWAVVRVMAPPGIAALRVFLWTVFRAANFLYLPVFVTRIFHRATPCPPIENDILLLTAVELAEKIRKRELTCEAVVKAYIERVKEVNPIINAVIEDRFHDALEDAKEVDRFLSNTLMTTEEIEEKKPLLGIPLTVKGSIEVEGMKNTSGVVSRANVIAKEDAIIVKSARDAGAIPILTSNIPELCLNWESTNKLVGTTRNPHNTTRTVGGSSGGEAGLLATAASIIGVGSDIAGSLRLPAHFCGVWGHKPTPRVVPFAGHYPSCKNEDEWREVFTLGPMARYAKDLKLLLKIIANPEAKETLRLDEPVALEDLRIYYIEDLESILTNKVSSVCLDALHSVVDHMNKLCHVECEKAKIPLLKYAPEMASLVLLDIDDVDNLFVGRGDGSYAELFRYFTFRSKSVFMAIAYGVVRKLSKYIPNSTVEDCRKKLSEMKAELIKMLGDNGVLLIPTFPTEAHPHGDILRKVLDSGYCVIFNAFGLPVTNCPVKFSKNKLPVGIQVVSAPHNDRLTLAVAAEIEKTFGGWKPPQPREKACY